MRLLFVLLLFVDSSFIFAQKKIDTLYLNGNYEKTRKTKAVFYRYITRDPVSSTYLILDYQVSGILVRMGSYNDKDAQVPNGIVTKYYPNGKVQHDAMYVDGKLNGSVRSFYDNGNVKRIEKYSNNVLMEGKYLTREGRDTTLSPFFRIPQYADGFAELQKFIDNKLIYPPDALRRGLEGKVVVGFIIRKSGGLDHVGSLSSTNDLFNRDAERVIELTKYKWKPGLEEGEPADMAISYTVVFGLK